ncbi:phosphoribosyltransferase [Ramlibacter sp. USB13]|uniref:Phosphoribosyltransferase n=1 Tax=Ramlibacter cellulosilyticus TaxID=2764187 RepID=A0A923MRX2_9BURK|nr:phosphoribosyltransferase family protein [Ramlibacter cellulosilyticus]MBC5783479.1 phosphoribosyltransferase [Ramlibacter cellulosilyticus]
MFEDRTDAAAQLAQALDVWRGRHPLVLAIPRGAVPMAAEIARRLEGELDLVLVRKIHAPGAPEFAMGAVDESGWVYLAPHATAVGATESYVREQKENELEELRRRRALYTPGRAAIPAAGRVVIVVDDGLATGATMIAALHAVRQRGPAHLVCAVPVASEESVKLVRPHADEVVALQVPRRFGAVSQFYRSFPQLEDAEVVAILQAARMGGSAGGELR